MAYNFFFSDGDIFVPSDLTQGLGNSPLVEEGHPSSDVSSSSITSLETIDNPSLGIKDTIADPSYKDLQASVNDALADDYGIIGFNVINKYFSESSFNFYHVGKALLSVATLAMACKVIDPNMMYFLGAAFAVSVTGNILSKFDGGVGRVGKYMENMAVRILAVTGSCLVTDKVLTLLNWSDENKSEFSLSKIASSALMPFVSASFTLLTRDIKLLIDGDSFKNYYLPELDIIAEPDIEMNLKDVSPEGVQWMLDAQDHLPFHFKNILSRTLKETIKNILSSYTMVSYISETSTNLTTDYLFKPAVSYSSAILSLGSSVTKVVAKDIVKRLYKDPANYMVAIIGTLAYNLVPEIFA
jgi:hypothetical protein